MGWEAVAGGVASLAGTAMTNRSRRREADKNRRFQERMSNSSYQRAMNDMRKAGLNPILAGKLGGASTPGGAMANIADYSQAVNSAMQASMVSADVDLREAQTAVQESQAELQAALVPGAQGIATVTEQLANLAKAAEQIIGNDVQGYREAFADVSSQMTAWLEKLEKAGNASKTTIINVINEATEGFPRTHQWLKDNFEYNGDR